MASTFNVKNLFGVETRDNKGTELTWGEMDLNLKILTLSNYIGYDFDPQAVKQLAPLLLAIQDTDFNLYSTEYINGELPVQELCTLSSRAEELGRQAFLDLENLDITQNIYFIIPFIYHSIGEGLTGISPYMLKRQTPTDYTKYISWNFYNTTTLEFIDYDGISNNEYYQYELDTFSSMIQNGDKLIVIGQAYWD